MEMGALHGRLVWWWYRVQWWAPEGRTCRAVHQHGRAVYEALRRHGIEDAQAEAATQLAFDVLYQQYQEGARPAHVRQTLIVVALAAVQSGLAHTFAQHSP
jgi:hypothetical protein